MRASVVPCLFTVLLFTACKEEPQTTGEACNAAYTPLGTDFFVDISESSGIRKGNFVPNPTPIPINDHSAVAFADIDGDGKDDIVAHSLFPNP